MTLTLTLRPYQSALIQRVFTLWHLGRYRLLLQLPTGGGKTIIFCALARELITQSQPVLVIAHREELLAQAAAKLEAITGSPVGMIKAGHKPNPLFPVQVASIQTLVRRKMPQASLVIFDEAHHCHSRTYAQVFKHYTQHGSYILGCTATPLRGDGRGLRWLYGGTPGFEELIVGPTVNDLIADGHLSPFKIYSPDRIVEASAAGVRTTAGDYNQAELTRLVKKTLIVGDVVETWQEHAKGKRTVLFAVSVEHSIELAEAFREEGIPAEHLDGDTPAVERKAILDRFRLGETLVLCQHSIVTEGVDIPLIEAVQFVRPTKSLTIWFQAIGRALRPAIGKNYAVIIDHTDTHLTLPLPDEEIEWSLDPISLDVTARSAVACPSCRHVFRPTKDECERATATCPACNVRFRFEVKKGKKGQQRLRAIEILPAEFSELVAEFDEEKISVVKEMIDFQERHGYARGWVYYRLAEMPELELSLGDWREVGRLLGYQPGWAWHKWKEMQRKEDISA